MADYDIPVCPYCDAGNAAPRTGKTLPEWAARLPLSYAAGPGDPTAIAELMAAFRYDPKHRTRINVSVGAATRRGILRL